MPAIADTLAKRQAKIQGDLDAAEKANEETRALVAAYEKRLADAREEARRLTREQGEADSAAATAHFNELHDRLARQIGEAEKRLARPARRRHGWSRAYGPGHRPGRLRKIAGQPVDHECARRQGRGGNKGDGR